MYCRSRTQPILIWDRRYIMNAGTAFCPNKFFSGVSFHKRKSFENSWHSPGQDPQAEIFALLYCEVHMSSWIDIDAYYLNIEIGGLISPGTYVMKVYREGG